MNESTPPADGDGVMPDGAIRDMIASHLDGALDAVGQRRLAAELARSPAARRELATFLRVEAAMMRLAVAGQLGAALDAMSLGGDAWPAGHTGHANLPARPASLPVSPAGEASSPRRGGHAARLRPAALALAGCLVALLVASPLLVTRPDSVQRARGEMDRLAYEWMRVARAHDADDEQEITGAGGPGDSPLDDENDDGPPAWLVAAMGDEDMPSLFPDAG